MSKTRVGAMNAVEAKRKRERFLELVAEGVSLRDAVAHPDVNVSMSAYRKWRENKRWGPEFRARLDIIRSGIDSIIGEWNGTHASFAETFFGMTYARHHLMLIEELERLPPGGILLALMPPLAGKLLADSEPIPTPDGWRKVGDIDAGDLVFGRDGTPTRVLAVFPEDAPRLFRVTFADGSSIRAGLEHRWLIRDRRKTPRAGIRRSPEEVVSTEQLLARGLHSTDGRRAISMPVCEAVQYPTADLPLDPWALGYWLGNGARHVGRVSTHHADGDWVIGRYADCGYRVGMVRRERGSCTFTVLGLVGALDAVGVRHDKHIPREYLHGDVAQRRALLAGLLDSDGYLGRDESIELSFTNERLALDALELVRSLGIKVRLHSREAAYRLPSGERKVTGTAFRLMWGQTTQAFTNPRKVALHAPNDRTDDRTRWRYVTSIVEIPSEPARCFTVDAPDSLFVAGEHFIVSHNTTMYENYASEKLAVNPDWRGTVASESLTISQKILGRIKHRMEPEGPFPRYVDYWGPFKPAYGQGRATQQAQPWGAGYFNVYKKRMSDERDYSLMALGFGSSIVSTRTDHLHVDDIQSTQTLNQTPRIVEWFRQDALSRPAEEGVTTVFGTRVGEDDFYENLLADDDLDGIMRVVKIRAIQTDPISEEQISYWPERHSLDSLDRQRRKVGQEAWDRNYMQAPGASHTARTFNDDSIEAAKNPLISLHHEMQPGRIVYIGLDPALGGMNCLIACEVAPEGKLVVRAIRESQGLQRNEQIMSELETMILGMQLKRGRVSDVVIETMNFQKGLANDERLRDMQARHGFNMTPHLTGSNKYDESIGVASMAGSFLKGEIVLPYAGDDLTRFEIDELIRQLKAWKPGKRGTKLRQDRVMALWFVWILWQQRWKSAVAPERSADAFKRKGLPWDGTRAGLVIPAGVRL